MNVPLEEVVLSSKIKITLYQHIADADSLIKFCCGYIEVPHIPD